MMISMPTMARLLFCFRLSHTDVKAGEAFMEKLLFFDLNP